MTRRFLGIVLLLGVTAFAAVHADTVLELDSETGDYIGQGITQTLTTADGAFSAERIDGGVHIHFEGTDAGVWWDVYLVPPEGTQFGPGTYTEAARWPFQSPRKPGLDVSGDGRGCNTLNGWFVVRQAVFDNLGNVVSFAADIEQHCDGASPALVAKVRYNSDVPLIVQAPTAIAGSDQVATEDAAVTLDGSVSLGGAGTVVAYTWSQTAGPPVVLSNPDAAITSFTPSHVPLGGEKLSFQLLVTNDIGLSSTDSVDIDVPSKSDPQTYIRFESEAGDYIGQGRTIVLNQDDGAFSAQPLQGGVGVHFDGNTWWDLDFVAPAGEALKVGSYLDAERYPFQSSGVPGMDISGDGRGCNTLTGSFTVLAIKTSGTQIDSFGADFEQHCEGGDPALHGRILFNVRDPSVPTADAEAASTTAEGFTATLDGTGSADSDGQIVTYHWTQTAGTPVTLADPYAAQTSFTMPPYQANPSQDNLSFKLLVTDNKGYMDEASLQVVDRLNEPPVAEDDDAQVSAGNDVDIPVLNNDTDPDNDLDAATIEIVQQPSHGTARATTGGHIVYRGAAGFSGQDSFTYRVADSAGNESDNAIVTVSVESVTPSPTPSTPSPDPITKSSGGGGGLSLLSLLALALVIGTGRLLLPLRPQ